MGGPNSEQRTGEGVIVYSGCTVTAQGGGAPSHPPATNEPAKKLQIARCINKLTSQLPVFDYFYQKERDFIRNKFEYLPKSLKR